MNVVAIQGLGGPASFEESVRKASTASTITTAASVLLGVGVVGLLAGGRMKTYGTAAVLGGAGVYLGRQLGVSAILEAKVA